MAVLTYKEARITDYIRDYKNTPVTQEKIQLKDWNEIDGKISILGNEPLILKYETELNDYLVDYKLNERQYQKYQFNPKLLSYDYYGTTEMWSLILHANEIFSACELTMNPVKMYSPQVFELLKTILNLEKPFINENEEDIRKIITGETNY